MEGIYTHVNSTPNGNRFEMACRLGTSDQSIIHSVSKLDEYGLAGRELEGFAIDIGAHIGGVAVPLAIDHPGLTVIAVEPVTCNSDMLETNILKNNVGDRVVVEHQAVHTPHVMYGWEGAHTWVGNLDEGFYSDSELVEETTLQALLDDHWIDHATLLKLDCEGYEWGVLAEAAVRRCDLIVGEYHDDDQQEGRDRLRDLLTPTHEVTITGWTFTAVIR